jgi:hypothetical protein
LIGGATLAACGASSKPAYCSSVSQLESSVKDLPSTNVAKNGLGALKTSVAKVQSDATTAVNDAKSDFPNETSAVTGSVSALSNSLKQATSSTTTLAQVPGQVAAVVKSAKDFSSATSSKCG